MDAYLCNVGAEEECVLFECKGRFQKNYRQYVTYILYNRHISRNVAKIYRKISVTQAVQRISQFFTQLSKHYEQDTLQDDSCCLSPQLLVVDDERTSSNTFKQNEHVTTDLTNHCQQTIEGEIDMINIDDLQNGSKCSVTVLASGIFPRRQTSSHLSKNLLTHSEIQSVCTSDQHREFSDDHIRQTRTILTESVILTSDASDSIDRQVPLTSLFNQPDIPPASSTSYHSQCGQQYRSRFCHPRTVRRRTCSSQKAPTTTNQRQIQRYLYEFEYLTHRVNRLYKKIDRVIGFNSSMHESKD